MDAAGMLIAEVEGVIARGDPRRCHTMLADLADLFSAQASRLGEPAVSAFDAVMLPLAKGAGITVRAGLSARLADLRNAPREVVRDLAYDLVPMVATPVLERSPRLAEGDLVAIAGSRAQAHLLALARRIVLAPDLADVLAARGDRTVTRALARNAGARLSEGARAVLAARAQDDADLQDRLRARGDLPPQQRAEIAGLVTERMRRALERDLGAGAAAAFTQATGADRRDLAAVEAVVAHKAAAGIDEADLRDWLASEQVLEALVGLARLADVPSQIAVAAHRAETYESLLFLAKAASLSWRALKLFLVAEPRHRPPDYVLEGAFEAYQGISVEMARSVVRAGAGLGQPPVEARRRSAV